MKSLLKFVVAGIIAFIFLNILCIFYYINPDFISTKNEVTDFYWEPHSYYSRMTEGFGYGKMNNEGFNNIQDYNYGQPIDILLMGSSHMEGANVPQDKTTSAVLNELYNKSKYVYNIGVSGHDFPHIINNIQTAVQFYNPKEYVIIEISNFHYDIRELEQSIDSNLTRISTNDSKFIQFLKKIPYLNKIPYLRLLKLQYQYYRDSHKNINYSENNDTYVNEDTHKQILEAVFMKLSSISDKYKIKVIILYHPELTLNYDGSILDNTDTNILSLFNKFSEEYNVLFLNMRDKFSEEYNKYHTTPYGFLNTAVIVGHLNRFGHQLIANEIYTQINLPGKEGIVK